MRDILNDEIYIEGASRQSAGLDYLCAAYCHRTAPRNSDVTGVGELRGR